MGSIGDGDGVIKPSEDNGNTNVAYTDTQLLDSQMFHSSLPGWGVHNDTHDTVPVEDGIETQVVDIGGETQVLDDQDSYFDYMETQLVDEFDSDGEGTDKTEVLSDSHELCDGESQKRGKFESLDGDIVFGASHEHKEGVSVEQPSEKNCNSGVCNSAKTSITEVGRGPKSGSAPMFASVRVASLRASGLSARKLALDGANCESSSLLPNNQLSEDIYVKIYGSRTETWEEVDHMCDAEIYKEKVNGFTNANKCKVECSTARKLFDKNDLVGNASSNDDTLGGNENLDIPIAGLSYIYSQEPSDLSQTNALACVQKLIEESKDLFDNELDLGKSSKGKSNISSTSKGVQILAKKIVDRNTNGKRGIFDWDDAQEDEGGGDILCRRKEDFFGSGNLRQRSFMKTQKAKSNDENATIVHSDSKVRLQGLQLRDKTVQTAEVNVRKNLVNEFEEQSNIPSSAGHFETDCAGNDMSELLNVGLDTQIAMEAMEALFYAGEVANDVPQNTSVVLGLATNSGKGFVGRKGKLSSYPKQQSFHKDHGIGVATRQTRSAKRIETRSSKRLLVSSKKHRENVGDECLKDIVITRRKKAKSGAQGLLNNGMKTAGKLPPEIAGEHSESSLLCKSDEHNETAIRSVTKQNLPEETVTCTPIARRTRQSIVASGKKSAESVPNGRGEETTCQMDIGAQERSGGGSAIVENAQVLDAKGKSSKLVLRRFAKLENFKSALTTSCPRRRRSCRRSSYQLKELDDVTKQSNQHEIIEKSGSEHKRPRGNAKTSSFDELSTNWKRHCSNDVCQDLSSVYRNSEEASTQSGDKSGSGDVELERTSDENGKKIYRDNNIGAKEVKLLDRKNASPSGKHEMKAMTNNLPKEPSKSACTSPANCMTPVNAASPICIGNEYFKKSCKKNLSNSGLLKEISSLSSMEREPISPAKDLRKRRDLANVRVLLSNHLDEDTTKQLRKIVDRVKISIATSIRDATHFITDKFVRTRNMLEAIASGKPVVTHLWLENVGRAKYYIDEQKYILRDTKKEKVIGFNMQVSLAHARQHPLLQSRRVFITPSTKPGKEIISGLVKAVGGQAVDRVSRTTLKDDTLPEHLLVLSCEEDYEECIPFLEKGAAVYSSELLLNGIITQKLEYERYQLFADHVKRTRSTIWLKKGGDNFIQVTKQK